MSKRYHTEEGSGVVDELLSGLLPDAGGRIFISIWGIAETLSVLNRKKNERNIEDNDFKKILLCFLGEASKFSIEPVDDALILSSFRFIMKHNINSADALHMASLLKIKDVAKGFKNDVVLVASDKRLNMAASDEGITVMDPESKSMDDMRRLMH